MTTVDRNLSVAQSSTNGSSAQVFRPEPTNSIAFSRNAKGEPSWDIKLYFVDDETEGAMEEVKILDRYMLDTFSVEKPAVRASLPAGSEG